MDCELSVARADAISTVADVIKNNITILKNDTTQPVIILPARLI